MRNVHVHSTLILQSRIFTLLKTPEQKVQFSFAYLENLSMLICCPSQASFFSEGKKTAASAVLFSLQGFLGYLA